MSRVTNAEVQKKCPTFIGGGCPYSSLAREKKGIAGKCPAFAKGTCPFAKCKSVGDFQDKLSEMMDQSKGDGAHQEFLKAVMLTSQEKEIELGRGCPFFSKGCPFSHGKDILKSPSAAAPFSVSHCDLKAKCPAFKGGVCPYSNLPKDMKGIAGKCPAFKGGCPWKSCKTVGEYVEILTKMRDQHKQGQAASAQKKFFEKVMGVSEDKERKLGGCPFMQYKCQFMNDAHGKPIVPK